MRRERKHHLARSAGPGASPPAQGCIGAGEGNEAAPPSKLAPGLHLVATPIGNLGDLTPRAARVLAAADRVVCEDRRVTGRLLQHLGLKRPLGLYHEHNAERVRPELLARLEAGEAVALVSDAGTPAVSDPGYKLVREAIARGIAVHPVPGPSAVLAALIVSGLPTDRFLFAGFLPPRAAARRRALGELAAVPATLILFEAPPRLAEMLADAAELLGAVRPAAVARELTKLHEEVRRGTLAELAGSYAASPPRGEIVVVIGPPERRAAEVGEAEVEALLREALRHAKPRVAAAEVAAATGRSANALYRQALHLLRRDPQ